MSEGRVRRSSLVLAVVLVLILIAPGPWAGAGAARTLEVWVHEFPPLQDALTKKWIPEFQAQRPGVRVRMTAIPFAGVVAYDAKLLSALSAGGGPDVWDMGDWNYKVFLDNKFLAPIDPAAFRFGSTQELKDAYVAGTLGIFEREGKLYGLFSEYNTLALFYNLDMFKAAGIEPLPANTPVSWQRIGEIAQKLRKTDPSTGALKQIGYQFGFFAAFRSPQWYAQNFYALMRQYGQNDLLVGGKPQANSAAVTRALQVMHDFTWKYKAYDPSFLSNWFADLPKGRVAMVLAGTWYVPAMRQNNPNVRFGVAPHPVVDPANKATYHNIQWAWGWSVNANKPAAQQRLAQEFLAFMLGRKGESTQAAWWFQNVGYTQPRKAFYASAGYRQQLAKDSWLKAWEDAFTMFKIGYVPHSYDDIGLALMRAIDRVVYDQASPQESARLLQAELVRLVGR